MGREVNSKFLLTLKKQTFDKYSTSNVVMAFSQRFSQISSGIWHLGYRKISQKKT